MFFVRDFSIAVGVGTILLLAGQIDLAASNSR
jgi:hypothetical protein